jgi:hypothetical protein
MLLPSTVAEFVPALNIVPTWTAAVVFVLRARKKLTKAELRAWSPMEPREVGRSAVGSKDDGPDERQS